MTEQDFAQRLRGLAKVITHPLRIRIVQAVAVGSGSTSPNELAKRLVEPLGNVSYHAKILKEYGVIVLERIEPVRGALEHFYRLSPFGEKVASLVGDLPAILTGKPDQSERTEKPDED